MSNKIEILPTSSSHHTAGWAYVPDTRYGASTGGGRAARKRGAREIGGGGRADVSSRQNTAILKHLAELDRENHKDTHIPIPPRQRAAPKKESKVEKSRSKTTTNVRRILISQKSFKNYLDDEEAALTQAAQSQNNPFASSSLSAPATSITATQRSAAHRSSKPSAAPSPRGGSHPATPKQQPLPSTSTTIPTSRAPPHPHASKLITSEHDSDPLLRSYIPHAPSERLMKMLLSEPPLSYNAARATVASASGSGQFAKPERHFCSICGYWGRVKCMKCHARACGLDCYRIHEETRCDRFYG
ncbi:hypothetical protein FQN55_006792 [Onygenales sp. PD_40]|nr:hypothetical protein FQN55_006792 [Onygenales sp. PD_40]